MEIPKSSAELIKKFNINEFQLVTLLSKRVRELMFGAKPLVENKKDSFIETAFKEIISNKIKPQ